VIGIRADDPTLEQYAEAARIARLGLRANPDDITLLNNLAFALINCDALDDAERILQKLHGANLEENLDILLKATSGLLHFRRGDSDKGRELYQAAIKMASGPRYRILRARATIFLALEERRASTSHSAEAVARALSCARSLTEPDLKLLASRLYSPVG
jgi:tetratricopeptide (TPR) repeat protein